MDRRETTFVEWIISGIFLLLVLKFGYTTLMVVGLIITMGVLLVGAALENDHKGFGNAFWRKVSNNNWVYYTMLWLMISSFVFYLLSFNGIALPEINPLKYIWGEIKDAVAPPLVDPWANDEFRTRVTNFVFRNGGTWGRAAFSFAVWTLIARPVSFWDDWVARRKARQEKEKGGSGGSGLSLSSFLRKEIPFQILWDIVFGRKG